MVSTGSVMPLQPRISASELIRVLLAAPVETDLHTLDPVRVRSLIAEVLTQHGYDVLDRSPYYPDFDRHQDARRAVRRAYGPRFLDAPAEQAVLADPLREVLAAPPQREAMTATVTSRPAHERDRRTTGGCATHGLGHPRRARRRRGTSIPDTRAARTATSGTN